MFVHILQHQQESKIAKKLSEQLVVVIREAKKSNENLSYKDLCQPIISSRKRRSDS